MPNDSELSVQARAIVDANRYMVLGTADASGAPWVSPVWYATEDYRTFLWVSDPEATHSRNVAARGRIAIVIFDSQVPVGGAQAVYMSADAEQLAADALEQGIELFSRRSEAQGLSRWTLDDVVPPARLRLYRANVLEHSVLGPGDRRLPVRVD